MSNSPLVKYTKLSPNRSSQRQHKIDTMWCYYEGVTKMKCAFCGRELKTSEQDQTVCNNCINSVEELTDGREEEEIDE